MSVIREWLEQHGLGAYAEAFAANAIELDVVADLSDEDLRALGMPVGDRKRLARAIACGARDLPTLSQEVLNSLPGLVAYVTPDGRFTYVNALFENWYGKPVDQILGLTIRDVVSESSFKQIEPYLRLALSGRTVSFEIDTELPDGRRGWSRAQYVPDLDASGNVRGMVGMVSDVTELRDVARQLEESEQRYRDLIEGALQGIVINDDGFRPVFANQACADLFGYETPDELLSLESMSPLVMDAAVEERLRQRRLRRIAGEEVPTDAEFQGRRKDGSTLWLLGQSRTLNWMGRTAVQTTLTDITARREAEDELRQQSAVHKMLIDSIPAFVSLKDRECRFLYVNKVLSDFYGLPAKDFIGRTLADLRGPVSPDVMRAMVREVVSTGQPVSSREIAFGRAPGRIHLVSVLPAKWVDGEVDEVLTVALDITELKRVEQELRESRVRLVEAQRIGNMGSWERDLNKGELIWSDQVYRIFGVDPDAFEVTYDSFVACVHPDDVAAYRRAAGLGHAGEAPFDFEHRIMRPDGEIRIVREAAEYLRDTDGGVLKVIGIVQDVTEIRRLEDRVREGETLRAIGLLAGGIAHEFNNMCQVIRGNVELLADSLTDDVANRRRLGAMERTVERSSELTDRLLAFSRRRTLRPERVGIGGLVGDVNDLLGQTLGVGFEFVTDIVADAWPVEVDPGELQNAIVNLVVNARDAMPDGGRIVLRCRNVTLAEADLPPESGLSAGDFLRISIHDTGTGMLADVQAKAFEPFFTTKPAGMGTGLGLSMVYGFAKQSGGFAEIESAVGSATAVSIVLPRWRGEAQDDASKNSESAAVQPSGGVLIVEDNALVRAALSDALSSRGFQVHTADDGAGALAQVSRDPAIGLVISDIVMDGEMDGLGLAARLRREWPDVAVLLMSGRPDLDVEARLGREAANAIRVLYKPFGIGELFGTISTVLAH